MDYTDDEEAMIMDFNIVGSCLSLLGSLFILICFVGFTELRTFAFKLVALMSLADFFNSVALLIGPMKHEDGV
jgi:hypothetical protein